jgi:hypothetical protein
MADLNALVQEALASQIGTGGLPTADALYNQLQQGTQENTFGRGLGISTVTRDALAKARVDATLQAQQAQLAALGQAASVAQQELNRGQAASQFGQNLALQKQELQQQSDLANRQLMAQGIGLGVGGLANVAGRAYKPEIMGALGRLSGNGAAISPAGGRETMLPQQMVPGMPSTSGPIAAPDTSGSMGGLGDVGLSDYSMPDLTGGNISSPDILGSMGGLGDLGLWGGLGDLAGLTDTTNIPDFSMLWAP